jgi:hypothetical protein
MKLRFILPAAALAMAAAAPVLAQTYSPDPQYAYPGERIYVPGARYSHGLLHGGWVAPGDDQLMADTLAALAADPRMNELNVTVVAKDGALIMNGVAKNTSQAADAERIARRIANGRVTAQWTTQQG